VSWSRISFESSSAKNALTITVLLFHTTTNDNRFNEASAGMFKQ
jgi:hypothetical protein